MRVEYGVTGNVVGDISIKLNGKFRHVKVQKEKSTNLVKTYEGYSYQNGNVAPTSIWNLTWRSDNTISINVRILLPDANANKYYTAGTTLEQRNAGTNLLGQYYGAYTLDGTIDPSTGVLTVPIAGDTPYPMFDSVTGVQLTGTYSLGAPFNADNFNVASILLAPSFPTSVVMTGQTDTGINGTWVLGGFSGTWTGTRKQ